MTILRYFVFLGLISLTSFANAQYNQVSILKDTTSWYTYGERFYFPDLCDCPQAGIIPGQPETYPKDRPFSKFLNDTSLWEWVPLNIEGIDQKAIYDLKPQYKDTLVRNDGSIVEVPIWVKYPDWKKDK